jgi:hypothetical protein
MDTPILDRVEASLADFVPKTQGEFIAMQLAKRFNDQGRLAKYILASRQHPKRVLLEAARLALKRGDETGQPVTAILFELLEQFGGKEQGV